MSNKSFTSNTSHRSLSIAKVAIMGNKSHSYSTPHRKPVDCEGSQQ
ncbi:MAG: hypothetical protein LBG68_01665 [Coriobacteriales bacterium]|nr:hypothetical protein [Coriobacteriales bacterium]